MCNPGQLFRWLCCLAIALAAFAVEAARPEACLHNQKCGDVDIPFPFGIGDGCHLEGFDVQCNTSFNPPRPFIGGTEVELIDISPNSSEVRVYKHIDWVCYNRSYYTDYGFQAINLSASSAYRVSGKRNQFTGLGCATVAYITSYGQDGNLSYLGACTGLCSSVANTRNDTCTGKGCCQMAISDGLTNVGTDFATGKINNSITLDFNPCSYAFVAEKGWYNFSSIDLIPGKLNSTNKKGMPLVLEWAIRNKTCKEAPSDKSTYACVSEYSECVDVGDVLTGSTGYTCNCSQGYQGNPYEAAGCQDIDECQLGAEYPCYGDCKNTIGTYVCSCSQGYQGNPYEAAGCRDIDECQLGAEYPCHGDCTNTPGAYVCSCPRGTEGDARVKNGCISIHSSLPMPLTVLIGIMASVLFVTLMTFWIYFGLQKRKLIRAKRQFFEQNGGLILQQQLGSNQGATFKLFTQQELERATNNFDAKLIVGRGGHGTVYRGTLQDQKSVAIKKSKVMDEGQTKEFVKEMLILSQINHRNVIKILGCCLEVEVPILVYEFIPNGNVYQLLHGSNCLPEISMDTRLRILQESATALAYLHSAASPPIIHGDVKSSNILLDENYAAKVSDFGASKMAPKDGAQLATVVQGTCGYLDPEYLMTCQLTDKSDVYSFGVVILELLTRANAFEFDAAGADKSLSSVFLCAMKEGKLADVVDRELVGGDPECMAQIEEVAKIAVQCLMPYGDERPTMKQVAENLERIRKCYEESKHEQPSADLNWRHDKETVMSRARHLQDATGSSELEAVPLRMEAQYGR